MLRKVLMIVIAAAVLAAPSLAQQTPDLSGTWKLNAEKSDFGPMPAPISRTDVIEQHGSSIKQSVVSEGRNGKREYALTFTTDGKETKFPPDSGPQVGRATLQSISAAWQGSSLVVKETLDFQGNDVAETDTYSLSQDGKVLTINSEMKSEQGDRTRKLVFDKAGSSTAAPAAAPATPSSTAAPESKPNLTGTWKLNIDKSNFGQFPTPDSRIDKIVDNEPSVKIDVAQKGGPMGEINFTMNLSTDGKETTSTIFDNELKNKAHWDGNSLLVASTSEGPDGEIALTSNYTLGGDGKSLIVATHVTGSGGAMDMKLVYDKQL